MDKALSFLNEQKTLFPEVSSTFTLLEQLVTKRLYYQLSTELVKLLKINFFISNDFLVRLYQNFVVFFEDKLSPFCLVRFVLGVSSQLKTKEEKKTIFQKVAKIVEKDKESSFLVVLGIISVDLYNEDKVDVHNRLLACNKALHEKHGSFKNFVSVYLYQLMLLYFKHWDLPTDYCKTAQRYLPLVSLADLNAEDKHILAKDTCLSFLLGDIYTVDNICDSPIMDSLKPADFWYKEALHYMRLGDVKAFEKTIFAKSSEAFVNKNLENLRRKVRRIAFLALCAQKCKEKISKISLSEIAQTCDVSAEDSEMLIIDLICADLVEGKINEVDKYFQLYSLPSSGHINTDMAHLKCAFEDWAKKISLISFPIDKVVKM